jgi:hypothetical protein
LLASRPDGYAAIVTRRLGVLGLVWVCAVAPTLAAVLPNDRGDLAAVAWGGPTILPLSAFVAGALSRSELAGLVTAATWWIGSLMFGGALPAGPAAMLYLSPRSGGIEAWRETKFVQLIAALALGAVLIVLSDWFARRAIARGA